MEVVRPEDAPSFLELAGPLLERDEARNNLILGIAATVTQHTDRYPDPRWWVALDGGAPVAAAIRTPPHDLVLGDPASDDGLDAIVQAVLEDEGELPGVVGNDPNVGPAAEAIAAGLGVRAELGLGQGVFELIDVHDVPHPPGAGRNAGVADRSLVRSWFEAFLIEADRAGLHASGAPAARLRHRARRRTQRLAPGGRPPGVLPLHRPREPDVERDLRARRVPARRQFGPLPVRLASPGATRSGYAGRSRANHATRR